MVDHTTPCRLCRTQKKTLTNWDKYDRAIEDGFSNNDALELSGLSDDTVSDFSDKE